MTIKVAINGYGRIGRMVVRAIYEEKRDDIKVVAINGLGGIDINAHLTQYDSAHGRFPGTVTVDGDHMVINGDRIKIFSTRNPLETTWGDLGVDVVLECSGAFTSKEKAMASTMARLFLIKRVLLCLLHCFHTGGSRPDQKKICVFFIAEIGIACTVDFTAHLILLFF